MTGHVFVVRGDLTQIACDAWLLPTDDWFSISSSWRGAITAPGGTVEGQEPWKETERVRPIGLPSSDSPQIWLGRIGKSGESAEWYATGIAQFVELAGRQALTNDRLDRPPLLAVNHVGTGHGGARDSRGEVLAAMFEILHKLTDELDVDVVVVSWDARSHAAAQRARLQSLGGSSANAMDRAVAAWEFDDDLRSDSLRTAARSLAKKATEQRLAVFMGAGVSAGAGLPGWSQLLARVGAEASPQVSTEDLARIPDPRDQAALLARRLGGEHHLVDQVVTALDRQRYSLQHALLSSLPVREYTTTNFDELFELAAQTDSRPLRILPLAALSAGVDSDRWLLKLHGTLSDPASIVLTRSAYLDAPRQRGALFGLVQAMLMTRHMLFVGYGLKDETFHELVHEVRFARSGDSDTPLGTAITLFDDPVQAEIWAGDVEVVAVRSANDHPDAQALAMAGRDVERLMDLVGLLSADRWAFLLDQQYAGMLSARERELASLLAPLASKVQPGSTADGWRQVSELLERFGVGPGPSLPGYDSPFGRERLNRSDADPNQPVAIDTTAEHNADNEHARSSDALSAALGLLSEFSSREQTILVRLLDVYGNPPTLASIGEELGLTRERVRQLEADLRGRLNEVAVSSDMSALVERAQQIRLSIGALAPLASVPEEMIPNPESLSDELFAYLAGPYRIDGEWIHLKRFNSWFEVLEEAFASAQADQVATVESMRDALSANEVDPALLERLVEASSAYRCIDDWVILWTGNHGDRAARIIASQGSPLAFDELVTLLQPENPRSFSNALHASSRLQRVGHRRWALADWDLETYEGIIPAMQARLASGPRILDDLAAELAEEFAIAETSVCLYGTLTPLFVVDGDIIRLRNPDEPYEPRTSLEDNDRCEVIDGRWALRLRIDGDLLRGSGRLIPEPWAVHVGLQPLGSIQLDSVHGPIKLSWKTQPQISSLRRFADKLCGEAGDELLLIASHPGIIEFRLRGAAESAESDGVQP